MQRIGRFFRYLAAASISIGVQGHFPVFGETGLGHARQFDCVDAFDLIAVATTVGCGMTMKPDAGADFSGAIERLVDAGFFTRADFASIAIQWCPLTLATGFTPDAVRIFVDAGLQDGSDDLIAEVLAHEMIHVRQFRELGARGFKCEYVNALLSCGGCQDRGHALEAEAYRVQDAVRGHFLEEQRDR